MKSFPFQKTIASSLLVGYLNIIAPLPLVAAAIQPSARTPVDQLPKPVLTPEQVRVNRTGPATSEASNGLHFSSEPTADEIFRARVFAEPFVAVGGTPSSGENRALAAAITAYHESTREDAAVFEDFLREHGASSWAASVHLNLGLRDFRSGWFGRAIMHYEGAWQAARIATDPVGRSISDRAFGELVQMYARLGRKEQLQSMLAEVADHSFTGSASELIAGARDGLALMNTHPERAYRCGPGALDRIVAKRDGKPGLNPILAAIPSTDRGTSLADVAQWAHDVGLDMQLAWREPGAAVPTPAVVHWKLGHFAALFSTGPGGYTIEDPTFAARSSASNTSLDAEASGYFLIPGGPLTAGWRAVSSSEASSVWGKGTTEMQDIDRTTEKDIKVDCQGRPLGMAVANAHAMVVSLNISDTPLGYTPPYGPETPFTLTYNQREAKQPTVADFSNVGPKWQHGWMSYVQEEYLTIPDSGSTITADMLWPEVHRPGGGVDTYGFIFVFLDVTTFPAEFPQSHNSTNKIRKTNSTTYVETFPDGSQYTYGRKTGTGFPYRYFLTEIKDATGNVVTPGYDSQNRLVSVADALGQVTVFEYELSGDPLKLTKVTDPFGRHCTIHYDSLGRLDLITDVLGLQSSFTYRGAGNFIESMTTPYGTSVFDFAESGPNNRVRWLELTNPLNEKERVETRDYWFHLPSTGPAPTGIDGGYNQANRCTLFWDRKAYKDTFNAANPDTVDCTSGARIFHWLHAGDTLNVTSGILENIQNPLEGARTWFSYDRQGDGPTAEGTSPNPTRVARVLDDSTDQLQQFGYNTAGRVTYSVDPMGRATSFVYDTNEIDLKEVRQKTGPNPGDYEILSKTTYMSAHLPDTITDAAGQVTSFTYNAAGQVSTVTNAKSEVTTFYYDPAGNPANTRSLLNTGYLVAIDGPLSGTSDTVTIAYDGYGRPRTVTDTEGYAVTTDYDVFDRPTLLTYPDTTTHQIVYDRLDARYFKDRRNRVTEQRHNALRQVVLAIDPEKRATQYSWCKCGALRVLVDAAGNSTNWIHDAAGRLTGKQYADGTITNYRYETNGSRLKSMTDAAGQVTNYSYFKDDQLQQVSYTNATVATPSVSFTYETYYPRLATMVDTLGTTTYAYNPITTTPAPGAGRLASIDGPWANDTIGYTYDQLGRVLTRSIDGSTNTTTAIYDTLGRVTGVTNPLGSFTYGYVNATSRADYVIYPNSQRTNYAYFNNAGDQRLQKVENLKPDTSSLSTFTYTYDAEGVIQNWARKYDAGSALTSVFKYDGADQLTEASIPQGSGPTLQAFIYRYDKVGNRTSEQIGNAVTAATVNGVNQLKTLSATGPVRFEGSLDEAGTVKLNNQPIAVATDHSFKGDVTLPPGNNTVTVEAKDPVNNTATKTYTVTVASGAGRTLGYDLNGNTTNNGAGQTYTWDAANRLKTITQTSGITEFVYDGSGHRRIEKLDGAEIKRWIWCGEPQPCEERDGANTVTKRFYATLGEQIGASNYYYTTDHLGSVREMNDSTGAVLARYDYDPYGRITKVNGSLEGDFGFTGFYRHQTSGLNFTLYRQYADSLGRWLSRDVIEENGGVNLYGYGANNLLNGIDPWGLEVVGVYSKSKGSVTLRDGDTGKNLTYPVESGGKPFGAPIPNGSYELLERAGRPGFYRLDPIDSITRDDRDQQTGRDAFRLHGPGRTIGCVAARDKNLWEEAMKLINNTKTKTVPDFYHGSPSGPIIRFGILRVTD